MSLLFWLILKGLNELFIKASSFESTLREKDKNSRGQKASRPINFSYFPVRANRLNELFIKASSFESTLREKDKNSRGQKASYQFFLFSCQS
ncbi:hypothetical protein CYV31_06870 [Carnobacterium maltaromaticum]|nr:hypothetical protein CYV31_06870 [Carnobacterium maltaromaticum]